MGTARHDGSGEQSTGREDDVEGTDPPRPERKLSRHDDMATVGVHRKRWALPDTTDAENNQPEGKMMWKGPTPFPHEGEVESEVTRRRSRGLSTEKEASPEDPTKKKALKSVVEKTRPS